MSSQHRILKLDIPRRDLSSFSKPQHYDQRRPNSSSPLPHQHRFDLSDLDRVHLIGQTGSGSSVYKVIHRPTSKPYALRTISADRPDDVKRIIYREAIRTCRLAPESPNIVKLHDVFGGGGSDADEIQLLMDYMDGGSLKGIQISREDQLAFIARQVLRGLNDLHQRKMVHRDIRPSNIMASDDMKNVKIGNCGVSLFLKETHIAYVSPERINTDLSFGLYDGYKGDVWGLGVCLLEIYMGRYPFDVDTPNDWTSLMTAICMAEPPQAPPNASPEFRDFVVCCLRKDPTARWTVAQLLEHPFVIEK